VANTPQQALTLLNDPTFVEAARVLAQKLLERPGGSDSERIDALYLRALGRPPRDAERASLRKFLTSVRGTYRDNPDDARKLLKVGLAPAPDYTSAGVSEAELAAWASVCRVVLNLHETITRY
jgi:hypothetical protein